MEIPKEEKLHGRRLKKRRPQKHRKRGKKTQPRDDNRAAPKLGGGRLWGGGCGAPLSSCTVRGGGEKLCPIGCIGAAPLREVWGQWGQRGAAYGVRGDTEAQCMGSVGKLRYGVWGLWGH